MRTMAATQLEQGKKKEQNYKLKKRWKEEISYTYLKQHTKLLDT